VRSFRATQNIFTRTQSQDRFFGVVAVVSVISSPVKQLRFFRRFSIVLSFQGTETTLTVFRTQDTLSGLWVSWNLFLISKNKHAKFGANQHIHSRGISKHTILILCLRCASYAACVCARERVCRGGQCRQKSLTLQSDCTTDCLNPLNNVPNCCVYRVKVRVPPKRKLRLCWVQPPLQSSSVRCNSVYDSPSGSLRRMSRHSA
jgi:hypothetical protein